MKACLLSLLIYSNPSAKEHSKQIIMKNPQSLTRRSFLSTTATSSLVVPALLSAKKSQSGPLVIGEGEHRYEVHHDWAKLPDKYTWQTTHNAAVDKTATFTPFTKAVVTKPITRPFSSSIPMANSSVPSANNSRRRTRTGGTERRKRIPLCRRYQNVKAFAKLTLKGETVWENMLLWTAESTERARMDPKRSDSKGKAVHAGVGMHFCPPILHSSTTGASSSPTDTVRSVSTGTTRMPIGYRSSVDRERAKEIRDPRGIWIDRREGKTTHRHLRPEPTTPCSSWKWTKSPKPSRATVCRQTWILGRICYWSPNCIHHLAQREEQRFTIGGRRRAW